MWWGGEGARALDCHLQINLVVNPRVISSRTRHVLRQAAFGRTARAWAVHPCRDTCVAKRLAATEPRVAVTGARGTELGG